MHADTILLYLAMIFMGVSVLAAIVAMIFSPRKSQKLAYSRKQLRNWHIGFTRSSTWIREEDLEFFGRLRIAIQIMILSSFCAFLLLVVSALIQLTST